VTVVSGSLTVGIDIGTTATKAVAVSEGGEVLARSRVPHEVRTPAPDLLEHDAARAWRRGPLKALSELSKKISGSPLAGVCVAGMVPSLAAVGPRGVPLSPGLLYGDRRGVVQGEGAEAARSEAGLPDAEGFVAYMAGEFPAARGYWPAQAVADFALSGVPAIDSAVAMTLGSLMSEGKWDPEVLGAYGVSTRQMPEVVPMGGAAGRLRNTEAVVAAGTIDALCDQIVAGADEPGDVLVICGATLIVWAVTSDWTEAPGCYTVPHTVAGRCLVGGPSNAGALFVDWARGLLSKGNARPVAAVGDPGSAGSAAEPARKGDPERVPVWIPYVRGERVPFHDPLLRSSLHGLDLTQDPSALERAAFEASGFVVRHMLDRAGVDARRIVASGGGTRVVPWMQAIADATGLPVDVVAVPEGAAFGAAYVARMAAGLVEGLDDARAWARVGRRVEPESAWQAAADERYKRFLSYGPSRPG
jgi:xylulokinase